MQAINDVFIPWEERYVLGIPFIDDQHKTMLGLANATHETCLQGSEFAQANFPEAARAVVEYIKMHFTAEEKIMEQASYPWKAEHRAEHQDFVKQVLAEVRNFEHGKSFVPFAFSRLLKEWVRTHIAMTDKSLGNYLVDKAKKGQFNINYNG